MTRRKNARGGFSLIEMMVVVAIIGIVVGLAVPMFSANKVSAEHRRVTQRLVGSLKRAQAMARSGKSGLAGWAVGDRTQTAGVRFVNATTYAIFVDNDRISNGAASEVDIEFVNISPNGEPFALFSAQAEIRFAKNGTLPAPADVLVRISADVGGCGTNPTNSGPRCNVVGVTYGGRASVQ